MYYMIFDEDRTNPEKYKVNPLIVTVHVHDSTLKAHDREEVMHNVRRDMSDQLYKFLLEYAAEALDIKREYDVATQQHVFTGKLTLLVKDGK